MAVELKDLAEYLGYTDEQLAEIENVDALKTDLDKQFIRRENALKDKEFLKSASGKLLNSLETKFIATAKEYGIEYAPEEVKGVALEKLFDAGFKKLTTASTTALEEVKNQIGKPDEVVKELQNKIQLVQKERDDFKGLLETTKSDFTGYKEKTATEIKNAKLNFQKDQEFNKLIPLFKPNATELEKTGFTAMVNAKVKFDYDEANNFIVTDLEGHLIPNKAKHGEFLKPDEYLKTVATESGIIGANPHAKKIDKPFTPVVPASNGNGEPQGRKINSFRPTVSQR